MAGKIALVTGGGTGIGKMISKAFVKNGAIVYIASRTKKTLDEADASEKLVTDFKNLGNDKLDILVNNSDLIYLESLTNFPEDMWDKLFNLNVKSVFYLTIACLPLLEKASKKPVDPSKVIITGSIVEIKLMQARRISSLPYNSSKFAAHGVAKNLAVHLTPRGVNVNVIAPGTVPTKPQPDKYFEISNNDIPQDMAGAALYLASGAGSWVTGTEIAVDGGHPLKFKLTDVEKLV
ncbi:5555_t:CDS:2, partial [Scutellospora calospora]